MSMDAATRLQQRGQALTELAVVLPFIVLLVLGLFDAGRLVIDYATLTNASKVGARVAMVNQSNDTTCGSVRTFKCALADHAGAMDITPSSVGDVVVNGTDCVALGGCTVSVTAQYDFELITPLINDIIGPVALTSTTTMPLERTYSSP
jgi:Flp pilus assembly protein TadG